MTGLVIANSCMAHPYRCSYEPHPPSVTYVERRSEFQDERRKTTEEVMSAKEVAHLGNIGKYYMAVCEICPYYYSGLST